ncbi:MAG: MBL fold metallo-hydrolase [Planctomycetes bacterium]|nr:MBL fold metallo-hydrolase [Planctomycetota bacterium]
MKIDHLILGAYETNCYVLRESDSAKDCLIIDPGLNARKLLELLSEHNLNPVAVILTHGHIDHITGVADLHEKYPDMKIYIHTADAGMLTGVQSNLSEMTGNQFTTAAADVLLEQDSVIDQAGIKLLVFHTPGHTPGGICLYLKEQGIVFVGDTLFADFVGRTDFPGGSSTQLINSIKEKLLTLPGETIVYTGHGPSTTIAQEKQTTPFLN